MEQQFYPGLDPRREGRVVHRAAPAGARERDDDKGPSGSGATDRPLPAPRTPPPSTFSRPGGDAARVARLDSAAVGSRSPGAQGAPAPTWIDYFCPDGACALELFGLLPFCLLAS